MARLHREYAKTMGCLHPENVTEGNCVRVTMELQRMFVHHCEISALFLERMAGQPSPASGFPRA